MGVWCGPDFEGTIEKNYREKVKSIKTSLNIWAQRNLSLKGKVSVLRTFILPQILYIVSSLYTPEWVVTEVENMFFEFLWSNKKAHVKKSVVINEVSNGGLKMPLFSAIVKSIKVMWIKRILSKEGIRHDLIKHFVHYKDNNIVDIINSKLMIDMVCFNSLFYKQVFTYWYDIHSVEPENVNDIMNCSIWNNAFITVDKKPIHYSIWQEKGIRQIKDIVKNDGSFRSKKELEEMFVLKIKQMDYK